ncbi:MAG: hypothetical protein LBB63_03310, partial [Holosporaceae bacterium]|nr:hypothetical protein [Holosporaceae bacterium]
ARGAGKSSDGRSSIAYRVKSYGSSAKDDAPGGVPPQTQAEHKYTVKSIGGSGSQKYFQSDCCK